VKPSINRLRLIGYIEGISFLVLLLFAMPMKYMAGKPSLVMWGGWIHGVLFILFCFALLETKIKMHWKIKTAVVPLIAALVPCGPFLIDRWLKDSDRNRS
jgi:integral membrane protein